jgi:hypothetical protein
VETFGVGRIDRFELPDANFRVGRDPPATERAERVGRGTLPEAPFSVKAREDSEGYALLTANHVVEAFEQTVATCHNLKSGA